MNNKDKLAWTSKTKKLNIDRVLSVGNIVTDMWGSKGVVVKIVMPENCSSFEDHGTVFVWQSEKVEYGSDNCEHYPFHSWKELLRIHD